jgi:hypothetical protein
MYEREGELITFKPVVIHKGDMPFVNDIPANLSAKDKARLRLAQKRVAAWNEERKKPADNDKPRCRHLSGGVVWKQPETIRPDILDWETW